MGLRFLFLLLALLSLTAGVSTPSGTVLCFAADHVAVEAAIAGGHECGEADAPADPTRDGHAGQCVDVELCGAATSRPAPPDAPPQGSLTAIVPLAAVLAMAIPPRPSFERAHLSRPPDHLASLRSFVLLT